jgi:hypothetical protein
VKHFQFRDYASYLKSQRRKAKKTQYKTSDKKAYYRQVAKNLKSTYPEFDKIICVGCRHETEIQCFKDNGFDAVGIDLFEDASIIQCDMSKIHEHPYFKDKTIPVMYASHSLEHCLDFDGFLKGVDHLGVKVLRVECPFVDKIRSWDCTFYDFMNPALEDLEDINKSILKYFLDFRIEHLELQDTKKRKADNIVFTLRRD